MKAATAFAAALLLAVGGPAAAEEPAQVAAPAIDEAELAEARAIMDIVFPPAEREETFGVLMEQTLDQFRGSLPLDDADPGLRDILDRYLDRVPARLAPTLRAHLPLIIEATAVAYTNEFTLEELRDIHAFARSPSGKRYLQRSTALMGDPAVAAANTAYFTDVMAVDGEMRRELVEELNAYFESRLESEAAMVPPPPS